MTSKSQPEAKPGSGRAKLRLSRAFRLARRHSHVSGDLLFALARDHEAHPSDIPSYDAGRGPGANSTNRFTGGVTSEAKQHGKPRFGRSLTLPRLPPGLLHVIDNVVPEFRAFDLGRPFHQAREVVGDPFARNGLVQSFNHEIRGFPPTKVPQHHLSRKHH
jgi:hypothetical protein